MMTVRGIIKCDTTGGKLSLGFSGRMNLPPDSHVGAVIQNGDVLYFVRSIGPAFRPNATFRTDCHKLICDRAPHVSDTFAVLDVNDQRRGIWLHDIRDDGDLTIVTCSLLEAKPAGGHPIAD